MKTMTTLMDMEVGQQLDVVPAMFAPNQQLTPWLMRSREFTTSTLGLIEMSPAQLYFWDLESYVGVQQRLLSEEPPVLAGAEVALRYLPVMDVSGDYYDVVPLGGEQTGLAMGDVCGKGMVAAPLVAYVCVNLRAHAQAYQLTAGELLSCLNRAIHQDSPTDRFVTLTYGLWDACKHTFTYSLAGHPPVLHYQAATGCVSQLEVGGTVLGVWEEAEYPTESVSLGLGDVLVLYTDGIIEASDARDETFGIQRLSETVAEHGEESSEGLASAILNAASQFAEREWEDDVTLMVLKRTDR